MELWYSLRENFSWRPSFSAYSQRVSLTFTTAFGWQTFKSSMLIMFPGLRKDQDHQYLPHRSFAEFSESPLLTPPIDLPFPRSTCTASDRMPRSAPLRELELSASCSGVSIFLVINYRRRLHSSISNTTSLSLPTSTCPPPQSYSQMNF